MAEFVPFVSGQQVHTRVRNVVHSKLGVCSMFELLLSCAFEDRAFEMNCSSMLIGDGRVFIVANGRGQIVLCLAL